MTWLVGENEVGARLDQALAALAGLSRSQARRWIDEGRVRVNDARVAASHRVQPGDLLEADVPDPRPSPLAPEATPLVVLYEDDDVVVIDKPAGMVVHPAPGHESGTLVNALLHHCADLAGVGGVLRPGIVHRLDRGTSGVLVAAKNDEAHRALAAQFHDHSVLRSYRALVRGVPGEDEGRVEKPIGRHPRDRKRMSVVTRRGRAAVTRWRMLRRYPHSDRSWLEVLPETGRTHQIRVHLASVGLPIVADPVYGRRGSTPVERELNRPALHAQLLGFTHPRTGARLRFEAPPPPDLQALLEKLERREAER